MPRKPRVHFTGAIYHAMARGVEGRAIFIDDEDRMRFLSHLRLYAGQLDAEILAYCLMNNHFHLAIKVGPAALGRFIQRLTGGYAASFNYRYERTGHLFQGRHNAKLCLDDRYLATVIHYIHMNPVRAGLVSHPGDWKWSSYKPPIGPVPDIDGFQPWATTESNPLLLRPEPEDMTLDQVAGGVEEVTGVGAMLLRSYRRDEGVSSARQCFIQEAIRRGHSLASVAKWLKMTRSSISRRVNNATTGRSDPIDGDARISHPTGR